jgi:hypothetical protein
MRYVAINRPNEFSGSLWNFDIDGIELKKDHKDLLFHKVFPLLQGGGSAAILGLASLTGSEEHDLELSVRRAEAVAKYMHALWDWTPTDPLKFYGGPMRLGKPRASGKAVADAYYESHKGKRGNIRENDFFRAVWVHVWDKPNPPSEEVIVPAITMPDLPLTNDQIEFGKWLDVIAWIESASPVAELLPPLDLAIAIADTLFALPAAWAAGDQGAFLNGYIVAYDRAMQDMADAYGNSVLDRMSHSRWPEIPVPQVHKEMWAAQTTPFQDKGHQGEEAGCKAAYDGIKRLEKHPFWVDIRVRGYVTQQSFTGKETLRALSKKYRDNVGGYFMDKFRSILRAKGYSANWPFRPP